MTEIPQQWRTYARLQSELSNKQTVDSHTWGIEAGLDWCLTTTGTASSDALIRAARAISTASRRERSQARQRQVYLTPALDCPARAEAQLTARSDLAYVAKSLEGRRLQLLLAVATGSSYTELSSSFGTSPEALRVSVSRTRATVTALLARAA